DANIVVLSYRTDISDKGIALFVQQEEIEAVVRQQRPERFGHAEEGFAFSRQSVFVQSNCVREPQLLNFLRLCRTNSVKPLSAEVHRGRHRLAEPYHHVADKDRAGVSVVDFIQQLLLIVARHLKLPSLMPLDSAAIQMPSPG